jgi:glycosyltransferase involved in cell wall biosynthesis
MMNRPLVSILLPSRNRPERCRQAIQSLFDTSANPMCFDVLIRNDRDDPTLPDYVKMANAFPNVFRLEGERGQGYGSVPAFYNELSEWGTAPWILFWNDDAMMLGANWDTLLLDVPLQGHYVQPETHRLGGSVYRHNADAPMPFLPRGCWKQYGEPKIPAPTDTGLHQLLVVKHGWKVHYLEGVTLWHQRDSEDTLAKHRLT